VALGGVGFGHRMTPTVDADLIAFLEVGGTLADICDDTPTDTHLAVICEACQLMKSVDQSPVSMASADLGRVLTLPLLPLLDVWLDPLDPVRMGRAPPVV